MRILRVHQQHLPGRPVSLGTLHARRVVYTALAFDLRVTTTTTTTTTTSHTPSKQSGAKNGAKIGSKNGAKKTNASISAKEESKALQPMPGTHSMTSAVASTTVSAHPHGHGPGTEVHPRVQALLYVASQAGTVLQICLQSLQVLAAYQLHRAPITRMLISRQHGVCLTGTNMLVL